MSICNDLTGLRWLRKCFKSSESEIHVGPGSWAGWTVFLQAVFESESLSQRQLLTDSQRLQRDCKRDRAQGHRRRNYREGPVIYEWVVDNTLRDPKVRGCGRGDIRFIRS